MPYVFKIANEPDFECASFFYDATSNSFILQESGIGNREIELSYSLKEDKKFKKVVSDFEYHFLYKSEYAENDIWNVFEEGLVQKDINRGRIGWLFPLQALTSRDHNYAKEEFFYPYSFNAYQYLLNFICNNKATLEFSSIDKITLNSIFGDDVHIFVLFKDYIKNIPSFDINDYIPSIISSGYYFVRNNIKKITGNKSIKLSSISKEINNTEYIKTILKETYVKSYDDQFIRFYFLYQIIELLIEEIFQNELSNVLNDFNSQSKDFFDIKESLNSITKEKYRISQLYSNYSQISNNEALLNLIVSYISQVEVYEETSACKAIYKLRSILFHNHRKISSIGMESLKEINDLFEIDIINLLTTFKLKQV